jgi:hypothetical protein
MASALLPVALPLQDVPVIEELRRRFVFAVLPHHGKNQMPLSPILKSAS